MVDRSELEERNCPRLGVSSRSKDVWVLVEYVFVDVMERKGDLSSPKGIEDRSSSDGRCVVGRFNRDLDGCP